MAKGRSDPNDTYDEFVQFYDLCYPDRTGELEFYRSLLRPHDRYVLELGCGTGVIAAGLGQTPRGDGAPLTVGLDHSFTMLAHARRHHPTGRWVQGNMSAPPLQGLFGLVVCAFNTLQMLQSEDEVQRMFDRVRELLAPAGRFVFDVYNPCFEQPPQRMADGAPDGVVRSFTDVDGHRLDVHEVAIEDPLGESVQLDWRVMDASTEPPVQRARLVVRLRHFSPSLLIELVERAGLRVVARYGDVRGATFDQRRSKKQVVVCRR